MTKCGIVLVLIAPYIAASVRADSGLIAPGATLQVVYDSGLFMEGPSWDPFTAKLYFSSLTTNALLRLEPPNTITPWFGQTQGINGTFLSNDGRLLCAQGDARRIIRYRIGFEGPEDETVLAEDSGWQSPNDLCQTPAGDIYFTTPAFSGGGGSYVYHLAPDGTVTPAVTDMTLPNGVIASNDGATLYVADSADKFWRSYPINTDGSVGAGSAFFNPDVADMSDPDGMTIDELGNLYLNGRGGLWIVSPIGLQLEFVPVPVFNTNATFGGVDGKTLYITGGGKVFSLAMQVRGALWRDVPEDNAAPTVDVGNDVSINSSHRTDYPLIATVDDDAVPKPLTTLWRQISGPAEIVFDDVTSTNTTATFPDVGDYVLELIAFDGIRSTRDCVTITITQAADFDGDHDVDFDDFGVLQACMTGAAQTLIESCEDKDIDGDNDVDQSDFGFLQRCYSGTGQSANPDCAN